jgi:hypothetical protein
MVQTTELGPIALGGRIYLGAGNSSFNMVLEHSEYLS